MQEVPQLSEARAGIAGTFDAHITMGWNDGMGWDGIMAWESRDGMGWDAWDGAGWEAGPEPVLTIPTPYY